MRKLVQELKALTELGEEGMRGGGRMGGPVGGPVGGHLGKHGGRRGFGRIRAIGVGPWPCPPGHVRKDDGSCKKAE